MSNNPEWPQGAPPGQPKKCNVEIKSCGNAGEEQAIMQGQGKVRSEINRKAVPAHFIFTGMAFPVNVSLKGRRTRLCATVHARNDRHITVYKELCYSNYIGELSGGR